VKLLSWNIQQGRGVDGVVSLARIANEVKQSQADIVCLQEVSRGFSVAVDKQSQGPDQCAELEGLLDDYTLAFGPGVSLSATQGPRRLEFGNAILSRWDIASAENHLLPWPIDGQAKKSMRRAAIDAVIATPLGYLRVISSHLEYHSVPQRLSQLRYLLSMKMAADKRSRDGIACSEESPYSLPPMPSETVICGDFNMLPFGLEYNEFLAAPLSEAPNLLDVWCELNPRKEHPGTCGIFDAQQWPEGPHCRDFVFVSNGLSRAATEFQVDQKTASSDHQPTLVEFDDSLLGRALK
jgi:endonuclease/exonuclease/phosphatase family metal-dependent hydrolase